MKKYLVFALAALLIGALATGVLAARKSNVGHLYLYEKDSNWNIVSPGAWGKMKYNLSGPEFKFVFNGHGLESSIEYSLIYYADQSDRFVNWGGNTPGALIGVGTSTGGGQVHIMGSPDLNMDLPHPNDWNYPDGAKIWLVPSDCYDAVAKKVTTWSPGRFLFEGEEITYDDTDVPSPP